MRSIRASNPLPSTASKIEANTRAVSNVACQSASALGLGFIFAAIEDVGPRTAEKARKTLDRIRLRLQRLGARDPSASL